MIVCVCIDICWLVWLFCIYIDILCIFHSKSFFVCINSFIFQFYLYVKMCQCLFKISMNVCGCVFVCISVICSLSSMILLRDWLYGVDDRSLRAKSILRAFFLWDMNHIESLSIDFNSTNTHKCQTTHIHSQPKTEDKYKRSHFTLCIMFFCGIIVSNISLINAKLHQFHSEWHWNAICMSITRSTLIWFQKWNMPTFIRAFLL